MKLNWKNKTLLVIVSFFVIGASFAGGVFFGYYRSPVVEKIKSLTDKETGKPAIVDFSPFWKAWQIVESKYVAHGEVDRQKMVWGAIQGMIASLGDPYTVFFPPIESEEFKEEMQGDFEGVGMEIGNKDNALTVIAPIKGSPAEKAGMKAGDKIIKIEDTPSINMPSDQAVKMIRGKKGTPVKLTILHKNEAEPVEVTIIRDVIQVPVVNTERKPGGIFIIKMYNFSANSSNMFRDALREFVFSGDSKLIIDLRGNPGGYLESAVDISSWFLPAGKVVAREKFSTGEETLFRSKGYDIFNDLQLVILVNEGSASASEIMAGALQEHGIAKLVGQKTFGKGSVQELVEVTPNTSLKITIAKWLTPNGRSISDEGLEPDVKVELTREDFEASRDPQMDKALEILK